MKAKEYYALVKEGIEAGTATALKGAVDEMFMGMNREVRELQEKRHIQFDRGIFPVLKEMNDKWNAVVNLIEKDYGYSPIIRDGFKNFWVAKMPELGRYITEIWGAFQKLFGDYVEEVIAALTPVAEALAGPILFGNEPPDLSEEELERLIRTVDNSQHLNTPPKKYGADRYRHPQKTHIHYNYIPRAVRNQPYQRRTY